MREKKNDTIILVRLPKEIKEEFKKRCDKELIDNIVKVKITEAHSWFLYGELCNGQLRIEN